jgi:methionyl aminopeptidase
MIILKSSSEIEQLRKSGRIVALVMQKIAELIKPGITTAELDRVAEREIRQKGAVPAFKGYQGYQYTLCLSVNEEVVHGIPKDRELKEGDIVGIDCGVFFEGFYGDHAWTYPVGKVDEKASRLIEAAKEALKRGIEAATPKHRLFDISAEIQDCAESHGFSVVRDYVGHGIGRSLHEEPQVPNFGVRGTGMHLRPGLVLALEPMINEGGHEVELLEDGWTVVTKDRKRSAHVEHTIVVTENGPEILSRV